jgi:all-trans-retinol 13,14-reductase
LQAQICFDMERESTIIIGGGLGGLFCGAILGKEGHAVKVLERHRVAGGGLHLFRRGGVEFETGMHVVGGFQEGGVLNRLCRYLGIMHRLDLLPGDDLLHVGCDGRRYRMPRGVARLEEALAGEFPGEGENIRQYLSRIYALCDESGLYDLRFPPAGGHAGSFAGSVGEFIDGCTRDERLRRVLAFRNPLYAGEEYRTPAYIHAMVNRLYIEGASRFVGGSQQLADALVDVIRDTGGEVLTGHAVTRVEIEGKSVDHVVTADGERHVADRYISSLDPSSLFDLLDRSRLQRSYRQRLDSIPRAYSAFKLYIVFKPGTFPYLDHACYYLDDYEGTWTQETYTDETWPKGFMAITPAVTRRDRFAEKMIVTCVMNFDTVRRWEGTTTGRRGDDYEAFKRQREERVMAKLERVFPGIGSCTRDVFSATPLTIRDYLGHREGALYGTRKDCRHVELSHIPVRTKLDNLLMTGQCVHLHGILGVPLTALVTCAELVGMERLLERIHQSNTLE